MIAFIADRTGQPIADLPILPLRKILWVARVGVVSVLIALALAHGHSECRAEEIPAKPLQNSGKTSVAKPQPPPPAINYAFERQFAQRMLKGGAKSLYLRNGSSGYSVVTQLPSFRFHIDGIEIEGDKAELRREVSVSDQDLQDADQLYGISSLSIDIDTITEPGFSKLVAAGRLRRLVLGRQCRLPPEVIQTCRRLETLELQSLRDTQPWIMQAAGLPHLRTLVVEYPRQSVPQVADLHQSASLWALQFRTATITDKMLADLAGCRTVQVLGLRQGQLELYNKPGSQRPGIQSLVFTEMILSGRQLSRLVDWFPALNALSLSQVEFDGDGWQALSGLTKVRELGVTRSPFLDDDLRFLPESLERFTTITIGLSCEGFQKHRGLPKLQRLALNQAPVTDAGLAAVVKVAPNLKDLFLSQPRITPAGIRELTTLRSLEIIALHDCENPDACLAELLPITTLREVHGKFSPQARAKFLQARPKCRLP